MPNPTDPPRPSLDAGPYTALSNCSWDSKDGLVDSNGTKVFTWLNIQPSTTIGKTVQVYWEVGTADDAGNLAVLAVVPQAAYDIVKNGSYNSTTGVITYQSVGYRFQFEMSGGVVSMKPFAV